MVKIDEIKNLSGLELELWEVVATGPISLEELGKMNTRYLGAIGKLKSKGFVKIESVHLPKKGKLVIPILEEDSPPSL